ncbi:nucleolin [Drosophila albomicans]|uniref:Nucleolin n=1 Tax=Drosophila albomicans TaxID=7291 RepID=A0A6P8X2C7_DROAB|nr:nucleolin [Drosophila albomicans]
MKKVTEETISDEEESITDNSDASDDEENEVDLGASATESDEDEDVDDDVNDDGDGGDSDEGSELSDEGEETTARKTRAEIIEEQIHSKYQQRKGTRLYVRFLHKLPLDEQEFNSKVKALHPLISKASKPRQKHARFCLVEFQTQQDRDTALQDITASIKNNKAGFEGLFVSLPKTDSDEFVNELVVRKQQSFEKRKTKALTKRATKQVSRKSKFTSSVLITNLPKTASVAQVRQLFENAVDIQLKPGKGRFRDYSAATVTLPSTFEARNALKKELSMAGTKLQLRFNTQQQKKRRPNKNQKRGAGKVGAAITINS